MQPMPQPIPIVRAYSVIQSPWTLMHYVTNASHIGLPPNRWPARIDTDLGNGQPLCRERVVYRLDHGDRPTDEVCSVIYRQSLGAVTVEVFNN